MRESNMPATPGNPKPSPSNSGNSGVDYVSLVATVSLAVMGCTALYVGETQVAAAAVGAVAGFMLRIYR